MNASSRVAARIWFQPFVDVEETCQQAASRRDQLSAYEKRSVILVADDEPLIRQTIVEILCNEGFDAVGVKDGMEAIDCASRLRPKVFLADVNMPRLNGIEAARTIRDLLPETRVICFSGHASTSALIQEARDQGDHFEFLSKPIRPEVLVEAIHKASS